MCVPLKVEENYNGGGIAESLPFRGGYFRHNSLMIRDLHHTLSNGPCMILVYSSYDPPMILFCGSSTPSQRLQGLNLTPKSEIRGVAGARTEGIWPGDALQGLAGGQSADTSPVQVFRTC